MWCFARFVTICTISSVPLTHSFKLYKRYRIAQSVLYTEYGDRKELWHKWAELFLQFSLYIFGCNNSISADAANQNDWCSCELNCAWNISSYILNFIQRPGFLLLSARISFATCLSNASNEPSIFHWILKFGQLRPAPDHREKVFLLRLRPSCWWWNYFNFVIGNTKFTPVFCF